MTMHHIATVTGSNFGALTFSNIPQTYTHLQARITGRTGSSATYATIYSGMNGDIFTTANYSNHLIFGNGSGASAIGQTSINQINISNFMWAALTANTQGSIIVDVLDYTSTSKNKIMKWYGGWDSNGDGRAFIGSGMRMQTAAVNELIFTPDGGFTSSSRIDLYGITTNPTATGA
jgi:hypothetical protein